MTIVINSHTYSLGTHRQGIDFLEDVLLRATSQGYVLERVGGPHWVGTHLDGRELDVAVQQRTAR